MLAPGVGAVERRLDRSPIRLGRDPECELSFDYPWLSRLHLVFEREDGDWLVRREGRNEVLVNGKVLNSARVLAEGDCLELGPMSIVFEARRARAVELDERAVGALTLELPLAEVFAGESPVRHLSLLGAASGELAGMSDPEEVARRAAEILLDAIGARSACVVEVAREADRIVGSAGETILRVSRMLVERALQDGSTISVDDASRADSFAGSASIAGSLVGPVLVAPLGAPARGVLYADRTSGLASFNRSDATFATVLAHLLGSSLSAARQKASVIEAHARVAEQKSELARDIQRRGRFGALIGSSEPMQKLAASLAKVAPTNATVLITGETGAGKELVARETHQRSTRAQGPFFALNCAALPESLLESELFGHKKGAFSGADSDRRGIFELASGGTVFLDEIGELTLAAQAKVLRVLESREILPLGGSMHIRVDVRLVAATHRDLGAQSAVGKFRLDLFYRLNVFPLALPPLRDRSEDILALVKYFLESSSEARRKKLQPPTPEALAALSRYGWPGNVRELAHAIERAAILSDDGEAIDVAHLPEEVALVASAPGDTTAPNHALELRDVPPPASLHQAVADFERALIVRELERDGWNRTRAAKRLRISRRAFMEKLRRYEIKEPGDD